MFLTVWWVACILSSLFAPGSAVETLHGKYLQQPLRPTSVSIGHGAVDAVYTLAPAAKAVLLLFHGCGHSATDFYPPSAECADCVGLAEEVAIARAALAHGFSVLAISSFDRKHKCWTLHDVTHVRRVIDSVWEREELPEDMPLLAFGASSGGAFVVGLACTMQLAAIAPQIMGVRPEVLERCAALNSSQAPAVRYPPAIFTHMPRDEWTAERVASNVQTLRQAGVTVAEVKLPPLPITESYFHDRHPDGTTLEISSRIHGILTFKRFLDDEGFLKDDPRRSNWAFAITGLDESLAASLHEGGHAAVWAEEMNVAYAVHEMTADPMDRILRFYDDALAKKSS